MTLLQLKKDIDLEEAMQTWDAYRITREREVREIERLEDKLKRR